MLNVRSTSFAVLALGALASCFNPVHSDAVASLGPEVNGVRTGPTHRPGQPCLTCHGGSGPGSPQFVFAGTIYETRGQGPPSNGVAGVQVTLTDASGSKHVLTTNKAGNFYLPYADWSPSYPVQVALADPNSGKSATMFTTVGRNGACAFCHYGGDNAPDHMPPVYVSK